MPNKSSELKAKDLTPRIDFKKLNISSSKDAEPCCSVIGQERAVKAIRLGLKIHSRGYNIFVTGLTGTGRSTTIKQLLEELDHFKPDLQDVCYVNNFQSPDSPIALIFKAGEGRVFKRDVEYMIASLRKSIPKVFMSQDYKAKRSAIASDFGDRQKKFINDFEKKMSDEGFVMVQLQVGLGVHNELQPLVDNEPVSVGKLEQLVKEGKFAAQKLEEIEQKLERLKREMSVVEIESKKLAMKMEEALEKLDQSIISPLIIDKIDVLKKKFPDKKVVGYLDQAAATLLGELDRFREATPRRGEEEAPPFRKREPFEEFTINLILDNSETQKTPVIVEHSPSYRNLFGSTERVVDRYGYWRTDFSRIRAGSLLKASGGFLVLHAMDLFTEVGVWQPLKRALMTGLLEIGSFDPFYMMAGSGLKPEPLPIKLKVVLIGERRIYNALLELEEDFKKIFKIKAEFDSQMKMDDTALRQYVSFVRKITEEDSLPAFDNSALEAIAAQGSRLAGRKDRISTRFTNIADLIREAALVAGEAKHKMVKAGDVIQAIRQGQERVNLIEDRIQEMYDNDLLLISTTGKAVGQINGLSVFDTGEYAFGRPTRLTVSVSVGRAGVINIEREAELSGPIHNKGVLVLSGYLRGKFAKSKPLVMSASICFEQSYSGVDGDSASSTEIYAILSALAGLPIDQGIAVTGSVNQLGLIQPIGGVNEKIEGFFAVCKAKGLTGKQGVVIPVQNVADLHLKDEVVQAVEKGKFHIYPATTIDEGIQILTGKPAGKDLPKGGFTAGSVFDLVDKALDKMAKEFKESEQRGNDNNKKAAKKKAPEPPKKRKPKRK
ncbi:putative ATP-dependent protease [Candidatus Zixiibacteriota bacterium]|nr:putative ATP-dependent protease [candidate division Zixibacteria bacterium]